MFQKQHVRSRRPRAIQSRVSEGVKSELEALSSRLGCTESEAIHIVLSHHFGYDPHTGLKLPPVPGSGQCGPGGLAS